MKKMFLTILFLMAASVVKADTVWLSSYTATANTNQPLCTKHRAILHSVCVSSPSATGAATIFVSTNTATVVTTIDGAARGCYEFDTPIISTNTYALGYTTVGTSSFNFLYNCY